jgi:hypothetical protein
MLAVYTVKQRDVWKGLAFVVIPAFGLFAAVSLAGGFNHHHRYVLPIYPAIFMVGSTVFSNGCVTGGRVVKVVGAAMLACASFVSISQFPLMHGFFNSIAGGPREGYKWLSYSNVEWGQDLGRLGDWIESRQESETVVVGLAYPVDSRSIFERAVYSQEELAILLRQRDFRAEILNEGFYLVLHVTLLSDYPKAAPTIAVDNRAPRAWVANSYQVHFFSGAIDLALLDDVYQIRVQEP